MHIHTVSTIRDSDFDFSLDKLREYVTNTNLDAIAITNHDCFDIVQFKQIKSELDIKVFPGIEISLESGHTLIIGNEDNEDGFFLKSEKVTDKIKTNNDFITVDELKNIFGDLSDYLVIPHYEKKPAVKGADFEKLREHISAGEVDSPKKFIRTIKGPTNITPVLFSDIRVSPEMASFPTRQTYVDCGDLTLSSLKTSFLDKRKVSMSEEEGNALFQVFENGQKLSTGLNVLLGERSSGKTHTLNQIFEVSGKGKTKFIEQFSLVQKDEAEYEKSFNREVGNQRSIFVDEYLKPYQSVLNAVLNIDLSLNEKDVDRYLETLLQSADQSEKQDAYSKTTLFNETEFTISDSAGLSSLIRSVIHLIENVEYRTTIEKHLNTESLKALACELIEMLWDKEYEKKKKSKVNNIVRDIKGILRLRTSDTQIEDVNLYKIQLDLKVVDKFSEITKLLQKEMEIFKDNMQDFKIIAQKRPFKALSEIKDASGFKGSLKDAFSKYSEPYSYLQALKATELLPTSEYYKCFVMIEYKILNKDGYKVSGGERSEFRLLQEIKDAQNYDILLIDEPESSFDNIFLNKSVNQLIKEISKTMPVVVVTHNNTVGASIKPDYIIYASKEMEDGAILYRLYSGYPADKELVSLDGKRKKNIEVTMNALEAGFPAYEERKKGYESIEN